jgi:leucyl aminopeptidase
MPTDAAHATDTAVPSLAAGPAEVVVAAAVPDGVDALGVFVPATGPVPAAVGVDRDRLAAAGFDAGSGSTLVLPTPAGPTVVAVGIGDPAAVDAAAIRDAAGACARAAPGGATLAIALEGADQVAPEAVGQAAVEGAFLARYAYRPLRSEASSGRAPLAQLTLVTGADRTEATRRGAGRGESTSCATALARDLANTPHNFLSATDLAAVAEVVGARVGLGVEVVDKEGLVALGCGGLLGVNAGSAEPPVMITLTYTPPGEPLGRLALVGKGIMYDSGGIALKPGDVSHSQMKNDMSGAAAILAAMAALPALGCASAVTGYLMCTDNMPSGTAMALGDVITMRGGTTVEVVNTDAEGRLVMADALVLAREREPVDALVDIATLTGACLRALGPEVAGVIGNDAGLVERVRRAAEATDEPVWELPLARRYRPQLDSPVADLKNLGGDNAGAITAALFLEEFVGDVPWAHIDIAGTAQSARDSGWHTAGCTGFGARLLIQLALDFAKGPA